MGRKHADSPTVMIVDHFADDCLRQWLELTGYRVVEESNVRDAVEDAADFTGRERPDLILLGLSQAELAAVRLFREDAELCDVPIVALFDPEGEISRTEALAAGCNKFIPRPENVEQLTSLIGNLLPRSPEAP